MPKRVNVTCCLKKIRLKRGLTQMQLSELTGISPKQISGYETNSRQMTMGIAMLLSRALHCTTDDLYEWQDGDE